MESRFSGEILSSFDRRVSIKAAIMIRDGNGLLGMISNPLYILEKATEGRKRVSITAFLFPIEIKLTRMLGSLKLVLASGPR